MMFLAWQEKRIQFVPFFPRLKENPPRKGFVQHDDFLRLREALPERLWALATLLFYTGCRLGEARKITWDQVDLEARQIRLEGAQTKNAEPRTLPLPDELMEMLAQSPNKTGRVFYSGAFRRSWASACVSAGLGRWIREEGKPRRYEGLIPHDLRRSAVRNLVNVGIPEAIAMKISGHKTRSVVDGYHIVSTSDLHAAMRRLQASARVIDVTPSNGIKQLQ
jgi:integrase